jgi:hypothetical protein
MVIVLGAALGLITLLARRSLWRVATRAAVLLLLVTIVAGSAMVLAGPRWPWIAAAVVLLVASGVTWKAVRWARAVHVVAIGKLVWFGWQWVMDVRDAHAWARSDRSLPPPSS